MPQNNQGRGYIELSEVENKYLQDILQVFDEIHKTFAELQKNSR
jgi:hypothetical protein